MTKIPTTGQSSNCKLVTDSAQETLSLKIRLYEIALAIWVRNGI